MFTDKLTLFWIVCIAGIFGESDVQLNIEDIPYCEEILKTKKKKCPLCGVGDIVEVSNQNADITCF